MLKMIGVGLAAIALLTPSPAFAINQNQMDCYWKFMRSMDKYYTIMVKGRREFKKSLLNLGKDENETEGMLRTLDRNMVTALEIQINEMRECVDREK